MSQAMAQYSSVMAIVRDLLRVRVPPALAEDPAVYLGDLALVEDAGRSSLAEAIQLEQDWPRTSSPGPRGCPPGPRSGSLLWADSPSQPRAFGPAGLDGET
jgi:hypothetical protein